MRNLLWWPCCVLVCVAFCANGYAGDRCPEPRIKFLDDLFCFPGGAGRRDPFEERIETERHDFTQSTRTVGRGVAQIESGYSYFYNDNNGEIERSHTAPETLIRVGISDDIELRVRWDYAWRFIDDAENEEGAEDFRWGLKLNVTDQAGLIPESALEVRFTVPTGGKAWTTSRLESGVDFIYGWEITERWELYGSSGFSENGLGDFGLLPEEPASDWFIVWHQSVALGTELTDRVTLYTEWYGLFSHALAEDFSVSIFNVGVDYYVTNDFVLDFRVGMGLNDDSDDLFTGIGGGYRF